MRPRRSSVRRMRPVGDCNCRCWSSAVRSSPVAEDAVAERRRKKRRVALKGGGGIFRAMRS